MYNFLKALNERVLITPRRRRLAYLVQLAFWAPIFWAIDNWTVLSFRSFQFSVQLILGYQ
jgi:hypothetical protein